MTRYKCDLGKGIIHKINQVLYERQSKVLMGGIKKKTDNKKKQHECEGLRQDQSQQRARGSPFSFLSCSENQLGG